MTTETDDSELRPFLVRLTKVEREAINFIRYKYNARSTATVVRASIKALANHLGFDLQAGSNISDIADIPKHLGCKGPKSSETDCDDDGYDD